MWIVLVLVFVLLIYMRVEAGTPKCEHLEIDGSSSFRLFLLTDLHMKFLRISPEIVAQEIARAKPDLLLLAGDILDNERHIPIAQDWLSKLRLECPAYACLGNHDNRLFAHKPLMLPTYAASLKSCGIELIQNGSVELLLAGQPVRLSVLDEPRHGHPDITTFVMQPDTEAFRLLMTHNPELLLSLPKASADFSVAGHFHGGQIWMPFGLEFHVFRRESLGRKGVRRGLHTVNGIPLYISRGLGSVLFPLRLGARPEMTIIDIK